jgi:hypothetical protein
MSANLLRQSDTNRHTITESQVKGLHYQRFRRILFLKLKSAGNL